MDPEAQAEVDAIRRRARAERSLVSFIKQRGYAAEYQKKRQRKKAKEKRKRAKLGMGGGASADRRDGPRYLFYAQHTIVDGVNTTYLHQVQAKYVPDFMYWLTFRAIRGSRFEKVPAPPAGHVYTVNNQPLTPILWQPPQ